MEYLQYPQDAYVNGVTRDGFKPCYKWNTFNTSSEWHPESKRWSKF